MPGGYPYGRTAHEGAARLGCDRWVIRQAGHGKIKLAAIAEPADIAGSREQDGALAIGKPLGGIDIELGLDHQFRLDPADHHGQMAYVQYVKGKGRLAFALQAVVVAGVQLEIGRANV